jgi:hypothetical protein
MSTHKIIFVKNALLIPNKDEKGILLDPLVSQGPVNQMKK